MSQSANKPTMNFSEVLKALEKASAFELYRIRVAINRTLENPEWIAAIRSRLQVGQMVEFFHSRKNAACRGRVIELQRKHVLIADEVAKQRWLVLYTAINIDGADVQIREQPRRGLGRNEVAIGDVLGFLDRENREHSGKVIRLNPKTVTLQCGKVEWRVYYEFLHRVVDAQAIDGEVLEIAYSAADDDDDDRQETPR